MIKIYTLASSISPNNIKYVGKTKFSLKQRLSEHLYYAKRKNGKTPNWVKNQLDLGNTIIIELIEEVEEADWENSEMYWIEQFKQWGFELKNILPGGNNLKFLHKYVKKEKKYIDRSKLHTEYGKWRWEKAVEANRRKIIQIDKNTNEKIYWNSITEAAKQYLNFKTAISTIGKVLKNKRKTYKKCYWIYK